MSRPESQPPGPTELMNTAADLALGHLSPEELDDHATVQRWDIATLHYLAGYLESHSTRITAARAVITNRIAELMGDHAVMRVGDTILRTKPKRKIRLRSDTRGDFWSAVTTHRLAERLFNPNQARITGLRELADAAFPADPKTGEIDNQAMTRLERAWYDIEEGDTELERIPIDRAPKYLQKLQDGESKTTTPKETP